MTINRAISRSTWIGASAAGLASALTRPSRVGAQALTVIRLSSTLDDSLTPILYGNASGLFAKAGLEVQVTAAASGAAITASVVGGAVDLGKSSPLPLISAYTRGIPIQLVAGSALYLSEDPITALVVAKDAPIHTASDLAGKLAATPALHSLDHIATQAWVDQHGGDSSTLKFVEIPQQTVPTALLQGRIDVSTLVVPTLANAMATGNFRIIGRPFDAIAKRFLIAVWFSSRDYVSKHPDVIKRFNDAFASAATFCNTHHAATVDLLASYSHQDPAAIRAMTRTTTAPHLEARELQPLIDAATKYGVIGKTFSATEFVT